MGGIMMKWKNQKRRMVCMLLGVTLGLCLTACGSDKKENEEEKAGTDWRTEGNIVGRGTITHDGDSVDVVVCVDPNSAAFYWDKEEKLLFDSVAFPETLSDAETAFEDISFDDIDGDGETDVTIDFHHNDDTDTYMVWIWDPEERYVFQPELSYIHGAFYSLDENNDAYFEENGLDIDGWSDDGSYVLTNGVASYEGAGDGYAVGDCSWEIEKVSDYIRDGVREIEFNAYCYIPNASVPTFTGDFWSVVNGELYDYYTGTWFAASVAYLNDADGYYYYTIEWGDESYDIAFTYTTEWSGNTGEWSNVLTKHYMVYLSEKYDGLLFAGEAQPDSYWECAKRDDLENVCPGYGIMDCETIDPYANLYFSVCY